MPPITVDPNVLSGAGESIGAVGDEIAAAVDTLSAALSGGARSGLDPAGLVFGHAYQQNAQGLLDAGATAVGAARGVGFGVQMSATNYSHADASSTIGGAEATLTPPDTPAEFSAPAAPSALGGGVPPPLLWSVIQTFIPDVWPDGDPTHLRATGTAWRSFASTINAIAGQLAGPSGVVDGQQIPERDAMTSAISTITENLSVIATEAGNLAMQTLEFADDVENTQNAIRDLLDRVSPSGFLDGLKAVFSGDALEELEEVADDVKTVLGGYGRQAEARRDALQIAMGYIDSAVMSVEEWARREFPKFLGDDVGNALATSLDFQLTLRQGILAGAVDTAEGLGQLDPLRFAYDPQGAKDAWAGLAESVGEGLLYATPTGIAANPAGAFDYWKDRAGEAVHAEDWSSDRPGFGPGKILFDVGLSAIPGGAAARTGKEAADAAADAARTAGRLDAPGNLGSQGSIARNADDAAATLDEVADTFSTGAAPGSAGPAVPLKPVEAPNVPNAGDTPTPHVADAPDAPSPAAADSSGPRGTGATAPNTNSPTPHEAHPAVPDPPPTSTAPATAETPNAPDGAGDTGLRPGGPTTDDAGRPAGADYAEPHSRSNDRPGSPDIERPAGVGAAAGSSTTAPGTSSPISPDSAASDSPRAEYGNESGSSAPDYGREYRAPNEGPPDPLHSVEPSGDGWHRLSDDPIDARYGDPLPQHWDFTNDPLARVDSDVQRLIADPEAPFGRAPDGHPFTQHEYEERFNKVGPGGELWQNFPDNAGAVPGTRVAYTDAEVFVEHYGRAVDRIGDANGGYLALIENGQPASWEARSLHVNSLSDPYNAWELDPSRFPDGWTIEVSDVGPGLGQPGGSVQVRILALDGKSVPVEILEKIGLLS